jgi:hypothetical protein
VLRVDAKNEGISGGLSELSAARERGVLKICGPLQRQNRAVR